MLNAQISETADRHPDRAAASPWRPMTSAPRDGRWLLLRVAFTDDDDRRQEVATAGQFVEAHGSFCGQPFAAGHGNVSPLLSPLAWMPQIEMGRVSD